MSVATVSVVSVAHLVDLALHAVDAVAVAAQVAREEVHLPLQHLVRVRVRVRG